MSPVLDMVRPRVLWVPDSAGSAGAEAVDLARMAGLNLDPWQALVLEYALAERADGKWAAFEVGLCVPRQNGKGSILEARELAGLFLLGERLIIHSAHQFDTSLEAFGRLLFLIESTPELDRRVAKVTRSHGEEGITLIGGQRIRFRTRTKGGGRGFTGDCLILDEAMIIPESAHGALMPTLSARPNPQLWYTGSAVDQVTHEHGVVFARVRERGLRGGDEGLMYAEWSAEVPDAEVPNPSRLPDGLATDEEAWAQANPALGIRISTEHVAREQRSMDARTFAVERLNIGDWPATEATASVIDPAAWGALGDPGSRMADPVVLAFDVTPDRSGASIVAAGARPDGLPHVELVDRAPGTGWIVKRLQDLVARHAPAAVLVDGVGPGASLAEELSTAGVAVTMTSTQDYVRACGHLFDVVEQGRLRHLGTGDFDAAIRSASKRPLGDAWAWSRKASGADISALVAATLALWGQSTAVKPFFI